MLIGCPFCRFTAVTQYNMQVHTSTVHPTPQHDFSKFALAPVCNVMSLICQWRGCSMAEAVQLYTKLIRNPAIVALGVIYHRPCIDNPKIMVPLVNRENIALIKPHFIKGTSDKSEDPSNPPVLQSLLTPSSVKPVATRVAKAKPEVPKFEAPKVDVRVRKRKAELELCELENSITAKRFDNLVFAMNRLSEINMSIARLDCDDDLKDKLRAQAAQAMPDLEDDRVEGKPPPIVISTMVREHLGYSPVSAYEDGRTAGDLYKSMGRQVKEMYVKMNGKHPKRRRYTENGTVKETNDYLGSDKGWIKEIVVKECALAGCHPRPRVQMVRGQDPNLGR